MRQYSIALIGIALVAAVTAEQISWSSFKIRYGKNYDDPAEELTRMKNFIENLKEILEHNERYENGTVPYKKGVNEFSDMSNNEFHSTMGGIGYGSSNYQDVDLTNYLIQNHKVPYGAVIPDSIDWREKGAVTSVDRQGSCYVCWAFAANGALEAAYFRKTGQLVKLSTQNHVDCVEEDQPQCYFGHYRRSYVYIYGNNGVDTDQSYPYEEKKGACRYDVKNNAGATVKGVSLIPYANEKALTHAIATVGPIVVSINSRLIQNYQSGVFHDPNCSKELNHQVLAVGYGTDPNEGDYYIIKNSYGTSWGENGFMKLGRNRDNLCSVATDAGYPLI